MNITIVPGVRLVLDPGTVKGIRRTKHPSTIAIIALSNDTMLDVTFSVGEGDYYSTEGFLTRFLKKLEEEKGALDPRTQYEKRRKQ